MQAHLEEADEVEEDELDQDGDCNREREHVGRLRRLLVGLGSRRYVAVQPVLLRLG